MNRADKIALAYVAAIGVTAFAAVAAVITDQDRQIKRQKKTIVILLDTVTLMDRLARGENVKAEVIEHIVKYTDVPNDPRGINKK